MEFEEIIKTVWIAMIVLIFIATKFKSSKKPKRTGSPQEEGSPQTPPLFDLEQFFGMERAATVEPKVEPTPEPKPAEVKRVTPIFEEEKMPDTKKSSSKVEFDLRKAVIMSEILTPKFKDE